MTTAERELPMRAWWVSDYECYAARTAAEALDAWGKDTGFYDPETTVEDVREAGPDETMSKAETGTPPLFNIRGEAAKMTEPGLICGTET